MKNKITWDDKQLVVQNYKNAGTSLFAYSLKDKIELHEQTKFTHYEFV